MKKTKLSPELQTFLSVLFPGVYVYKELHILQHDKIKNVCKLSNSPVIAGTVTGTLLLDDVPVQDFAANGKTGKIMMFPLDESDNYATSGRANHSELVFYWKLRPKYPKVVVCYEYLPNVKS